MNINNSQPRRPTLNACKSPQETMRIDLHVHSHHSEPSTDWFMERWNISESYSDPFSIYEKAIKAGMSLVTLTDHNSIDGCLLLRDRYGDSVLTGLESTASFPEDGCKVHILIYGIGEREFVEIQALRRDIYELRAYIREKNLAHSVAHATHAVEAGRLTMGHLEKLICLFNTFEVINGGRNRTDNTMWHHILRNLTPDRLHSLCRKHSLEPFDTEPWIKGFTGGSDDHGGIFIGRTFTEASGRRMEDLLEALKNKATFARGRYSDYETLVFSVYKVVHDFSRQGSDKASLAGQMAEMLFEGRPVGIVNRLRLKKLKSLAKKGEHGVYASLYELAEGLSRKKFATLEEAIRFVYSRTADVSDGFVKILFGGVRKDTSALDLFTFMKNIQASMPGILLSLPFFLSLYHLNRNRQVVNDLGFSLGIDPTREGQRVLWFTDTLNDLNGVSLTLREVCRTACERGLDIKIAASVDPGRHDVPPNVVNIPSIGQFRLPYYETYRLQVPSVLKSLREIYLFDPDMIYISTPGPIGMLGLLAAKLMNVKCVGFYHTDFALQARQIVEDASVPPMLESFTRWFYCAVDEIRVPSARYVDMLKARGFDPQKIRHFRRGVELDVFRPRIDPGSTLLRDRFRVAGGTTLLYAGRVSSDKGLDLLIEVFRRLAEERSDLSLLVVGDGPYLADLKKKTSSGRVVFAGKIDHGEMPAIYAASDLFVFPSATDTFGRAVLEAQACGLPAVVSDEGGPQEIILNGKTGLVARAGDPSDWVEKIELVLRLMETSPGVYQKMRGDARAHVVDNYDWEEAMGSMLEDALPVRPDVDKKIA